VSLFWLIDSAERGERLDEALYPGPGAPAAERRAPASPRRAPPPPPAPASASSSERAPLAAMQMTQAGFLPLGDLLEQLRACATQAEAPASPTLVAARARARICVATASAGKRVCGDQGGAPAPAPAGVFAGVAALLDPSLGVAERAAEAAALEGGGGRLSAASRAVRGATHTVCPPERVLHWLGLGVSAVTSSWVDQSAQRGERARCVELSVDATRELSRERAAAPAAAGADDGADDVPADADARCALLDGLRGQRAGRAPGTAPPRLLAGLAWFVGEVPAAARFEDGADADDVIEDSEEEEWAAAGCSGGGVAGATQVSVCVSPLRRADPRLRELALRAPALTLLLPRDGVLGLEAREVLLTGGAATALQLPEVLAAFYNEELSACAQLAALHRLPAVAAAGALLERAFLAGRPLRRAELLGARRGLEGLHKASREPGAAVYVVRLTR
jgi:hypothetical protein